jgi:tRNA(fMet)-specific endonuclease VapC
VFELAYGVENSPSQTQARNQQALKHFLQPLNIIDFKIQNATYAAKIRADLKRKGTPIGAYDLQIAATALTHEFILVTNNTGEFKRIPQLKLENWV